MRKETKSIKLRHQNLDFIGLKGIEPILLSYELRVLTAKLQAIKFKILFDLYAFIHCFVKKNNDITSIISEDKLLTSM